MEPWPRECRTRRWPPGLSALTYATAGQPGLLWETQNSFPSGSVRVTQLDGPCCPRCRNVAPRATSRSTAASTSSAPIRRSRCIRFFTVFGSGAYPNNRTSCRMSSGVNPVNQEPLLADLRPGGAPSRLVRWQAGGQHSKHTCLARIIGGVCGRLVRIFVIGRSGPGACPCWACLRRRSAVAAKLSCCRSDDDRRPGKFFKEVREGVSDRGDGVRSRGEAAHKGRRQGKEPRS